MKVWSPAWISRIRDIKETRKNKKDKQRNNKQKRTPSLKLTVVSRELEGSAKAK